MSIVIFEHSPLAGSLRLGEVLRDHGHRLRVLSLHEGDAVPPDLDDVHGIVSMGGPQSANAGDPTLEREMAYLRAADTAAIPVVGICLGCQLLAKALGGEVDRLDESSGGIELGWHDVTLTDVGREDVIHAGIAWTSSQLHWHHEQVTKLPPGARLLAKSTQCRVQAWATGLRTYGFQHHPEVFAETIEAWAVDEPDDLRQAGVTAEQLRQQTQRCYPAYDRLRDRLFENIAMLLMPVERRYTGLVKDIRH